MIFVTGPRYSGKHAYVRNMLHIEEQKVADFNTIFVGNTTDIDILMEQLRTYEVVILPEMGSGVIPMDMEAVELRERCGALSQRLAAEADTVVRILCGLPQVLKGTIEA